MSGALLGLTFLGLLAQAGQAPRDPMELLGDLQADLQKAVRATLDVRMSQRRALREEFDREIARALVKSPKGTWDHFSDYLTKLGQAERQFGGKDEKPERDLWIAACRNALYRQAGQSKETLLKPEQQPATTDLFNACVEAAGRVRAKFGPDSSPDLRTAAYGSMSHVFHLLVRKARAPQGDPKAIHADHVGLIDLRYVLSGELERRVNEYPNRVLKDVAKACLDRGVALQKK